MKLHHAVPVRSAIARENHPRLMRPNAHNPTSHAVREVIRGPERQPVILATPTTAMRTAKKPNAPIVSAPRRPAAQCNRGTARIRVRSIHAGGVSSKLKQAITKSTATTNPVQPGPSRRCPSTKATDGPPSAAVKMDLRPSVFARVKARTPTARPPQVKNVRWASQLRRSFASRAEN